MVSAVGVYLPEGRHPIIPIFQHSIIPVVSAANLGPLYRNFHFSCGHLSSLDADSWATHPASSKLLKNVEEAPLSRGEYRSAPSMLASREWASLIPLSRGGAAPRWLFKDLEEQPGCVCFGSKKKSEVRE